MSFEELAAALEESMRRDVQAAYERVGQIWPPKKCECGAAKLGAKPHSPAHSRWCPVAGKP